MRISLIKTCKYFSNHLLCWSCGFLWSFFIVTFCIQ